MKIKVLGSGCSKCRSTIGIIERAARDAGIEVEIVKVESPEEIRRYGVHATPAVVIDEQVVHSGGIPSHEASAGLVQAGRHRIPEPPDAASLLHRQGRRRQDLAVDCRGADAGRCRQEGAAGQHRRGIEPRRDAGHRAAQHPRARAGRARPVGAQHRPRQRRRVLSPARAGADGRELPAPRSWRRFASNCRAPAPPRSPPSTSSPRCWPTAPSLRPHRLRHRADRPHPAPAQPAQGLDRVPGGQRPRRLLPGPAFGTEDAGAAVQGRARRLERSGEDHRDPGDPARPQGPSPKRRAPRTNCASWA